MSLDGAEGHGRAKALRYINLRLVTARQGCPPKARARKAPRYVPGRAARVPKGRAKALRYICTFLR
jgi:hypothetical protein